MIKHTIYIISLIFICILSSISFSEDDSKIKACSLDDNIYFKKGSSKLENDFHERLERDVHFLNEDKSRYIRIVGYANYNAMNKDGRENSSMTNLELGIKRALAIAKYMVDLGADEKSIAIVSLGSSCPKEDQINLKRNYNNPNGRARIFYFKKVVKKRNI